MENREGEELAMTGREKFLCGIAVALTLLGVVVQLIPGAKFLGKLSLAAAVVCMAWMILGRWAEKSPRWKLCRRVFAGCLAAGCVLFSSLEILIVTHGNEDWSALPVDAVIVLGAGLHGTVPTPTLQARLETAAAYMEAHPDIPVVLSGGQGPDEDIPEAEAMYTAMEALGADTSRLLLEDRSTSTMENLSNSRTLLEEQGIDTETAVIAVVTNDFHIYRTHMLAERLGLQTIGVPAPSPYGYVALNDCVREAFAFVKSAAVDWP